jgi:hypothetical protein
VTKDPGRDPRLDPRIYDIVFTDDGRLRRVICRAYDYIVYATSRQKETKHYDCDLKTWKAWCKKNVMSYRVKYHKTKYVDTEISK